MNENLYKSNTILIWNNQSENTFPLVSPAQMNLEWLRKIAQPEGPTSTCLTSSILVKSISTTFSWWPPSNSVVGPVNSIHCISCMASELWLKIWMPRLDWLRKLVLVSARIPVSVVKSCRTSLVEWTRNDVYFCMFGP